MSSQLKTKNIELLVLKQKGITSVVSQMKNVCVCEMLKGRALLVILKTSVVSGSIASPINLKATGVRFHRYQAIFVQVFGV